jgi:chemotaxis protein histidine kinase CheA
MHNGALEYETEMGNGTCFRLSLPLALPADKATAELAASTQPGAMR